MNEQKKKEDLIQLRRIQNQIDGIRNNYREEIDTELADIDVAKEILHKMSADEIYNTIHTYPMENKGDMYSLIIAFQILKMANGDLNQADSLMEDFKHVTKTYYLYKMDIYDLYSKQLKIEEEIKNL